MVATEAKNLFNVGLYSPAEAALYAGVRARTFKRWVFGSSSGRPVISHQLRTDQRIVTFLDFVQTLAIREIRITRRIPLQTIRQAIERAKDEYGIAYPLAQRHRIFLFGEQVLIRRDDASLVQLTGKCRDNLVMEAVAGLYLDDLHFDPQTLLANRYTVFYGPHGQQVEMDPKFRFGEPYLPHCQVTARTLWDAFQSEGSIEAAAEVYEVEPQDVKLACRFYNHILGNSAV